MKRTLFFVIGIVFFFAGALSASPVSVEDSLDINNYLHRQMIYSNTKVTNKSIREISKAQFFEAKLLFSLGDGSGFPTTLAFMKNGNGFTVSPSLNDLVETEEFLSSVNKDFRLSTPDAAIRFQDLLDLFDPWNQLDNDKAIFRQGNDWFFVRDKFFDDTKMFKVSTDPKGKVVSVLAADSNEPVEIPDDAIRQRSSEGYLSGRDPVVSPEDSLFMREKFEAQINYYFEFTENKARAIRRISKGHFYLASLVFPSDYGSFSQGFHLFKCGNNYSHSDGGKGLLTSPAFKSSILKDFELKSEDDASSFEELLDAVVPMDSFDLKYKKHFQKGGAWYFVRGDFFEKREAYIVETYENGSVKSISFDTIIIEGE